MQEKESGIAPEISDEDLSLLKELAFPSSYEKSIFHIMDIEEAVEEGWATILSVTPMG